MRSPSIAFAFAAALVLVGCGGSGNVSDAPDSPGSVETGTTDESTAPTLSPTLGSGDGGDGADGGDGGGADGNGGSQNGTPSTPSGEAVESIPSDASPIATVKYPEFGDPLGVFVDPAGNIGCWISDTELNCRIDSYSEDAPMGRTENGPNNQVNISGSSATIGMAGDVPAYMHRAFGAEDQVRPQTLEYGSTVYHGPFVCGSEEEALTCWNSYTGAGAAMNRAGTEFF